MKSFRDQVTLELSKSLGSFLPLIGGAEYSHKLIPLFEVLTNFEETVVRTAGNIQYINIYAWVYVYYIDSINNK
jgi:hypothetical protein